MVYFHQSSSYSDSDSLLRELEFIKSISFNFVHMTGCALQKEMESQKQEPKPFIPVEPKPLCPLCDRSIENTEKSLSFRGIIFHEECYRRKQRQIKRNQKIFAGICIGGFFAFWMIIFSHPLSYMQQFSSDWLVTSLIITVVFIIIAIVMVAPILVGLGILKWAVKQ